MPKCVNKVVVFDLDDTIGHFEEISIFLHGLQLIVGKSQIPDRYLFKLLDLWPKFLRPCIMEIFETLRGEKKRNKCLKVIIYTNNMGPRSWTLLIKRYIEKKLRYKLFDKVITAYRLHEKGNMRTTHSKTYSDLLRSTGYGREVQFIFLDDQAHSRMVHKNIKYLHLYPYSYSIPYNQMIDAFLDSKFGTTIPKNEHQTFRNYMRHYLSTGIKHDRYTIKKTKISKRDIKQFKIIRKELYKFLNINKTRSNRKIKRRRTRREY